MAIITTQHESLTIVELDINRLNLKNSTCRYYKESLTAWQTRAQYFVYLLPSLSNHQF